MTNNMERVLQFYEECGGEMVMKIHNALAQNMNRALSFQPHW